MKKRYTPEEIEMFRKDPNVKDVNEKRLRFTLAFRQKMYEAINDNICTASVRAFLTEQGYDHTVFCDYFEHSIAKAMKNSPPVIGGEITGKSTNKDDNEFLLSTGLFVKYGIGITFSPDFTNQLFHAYPDQSIEEGIRKAGIDPQMVGYQRIYLLKRQFTGHNLKTDTVYSDEIIRKYDSRPYIRRIIAQKCSFKPCFFNEACAFSDNMHIDDILSMYELTPEDFSISTRNNILKKLRHWKKTDEEQTDHSDQVLRIQYARMIRLRHMLEDTLHDIGESFRLKTPPERKDMCKLLQNMPVDPNGVYTITSVLRIVGIPRSTYYGILKNDAYEQNYRDRQMCDDRDADIIRQVMDYKNIRKGARQIYMDMYDITGVQFGLNRIRHLMRKYNLRCDIRKPSRNKAATRELLNRNVKQNVLKRRFRLFRPDQIRLTDVTYIDYGDHKRAYGSAIKDPVTGRLIDFTISETNDLSLVMTSVEHMEADGIQEGMIFHSDQGTLYLTDTFQRRIRDLGMVQSMSKRGNCWDNAPQESFFGHFKDEVDYKKCRTIEELKDCINDYAYYYNNERHQWNMRRMTPVQYDTWLKSLSDGEYALIIEEYEKKYTEMKEAAARKAIDRAKTLGV